MAFCFELFVRSFLLLACITLCTATIQTVTTTFTKKKSVSTSYTTLQNISKIRCVAKCNRDSQINCTLAGYDEATKTCYLSVDDPQNAVNTTDDMHGVFFYEPNPAGIPHFFLIFDHLKIIFLLNQIFRTKIITPC